MEIRLTIKDVVKFKIGLKISSNFAKKFIYKNVLLLDGVTVELYL